jgi:hypothetical protein
MKISSPFFFVLGIFAFSAMFMPAASYAQQATGGTINQGSTQVEGQVNPGSGQLDGRVITNSRVIDGYIDLGLRHLGGTVESDSGAISGQVDYGNRLLRGRINGQEFVLDLDSLKNQIQQLHFEEEQSKSERVTQILGIVNAIVNSRRDRNQPVIPQGIPSEKRPVPIAPVPDENFGPVLEPLETESTEEYSTSDLPAEESHTVFISNQTSKKVKFHLKTDGSSWIPLSMNPNDELELDGNQKLIIKYKSDTTHKFTLSSENAYRFKESKGGINFFSYEREKKKSPENNALIKNKEAKEK